MKLFKNKKTFGEYLTKQVERDLKLYCLKHWGKWWATRFYMNEKAQKVYDTVRNVSMTIAIRLIADDDTDYMKYIAFHEELMEEFKKNKEEKEKSKVGLKK